MVLQIPECLVGVGEIFILVYNMIMYCCFLTVQMDILASMVFQTLICQLSARHLFVNCFLVDQFSALCTF